MVWHTAGTKSTTFIRKSGSSDFRQFRIYLHNQFVVSPIHMQPHELYAERTKSIDSVEIPYSMCSSFWAQIFTIVSRYRMNSIEFSVISLIHSERCR